MTANNTSVQYDGNGLWVTNSTSSTWSMDSTNSTTCGTHRVASHFQSRQAASGDCNESKAHDNGEKALFHGLKSAYRMSRQSTGEYGTNGPPPYEAAARAAANVALAYMQAHDADYDREESFEYLEEKVLTGGVVDSLLDLFRGERVITDSDLSDGIDCAWTQIDDKWHHDDAARTALAISEAYLGEEVHE